MNVRFKYLSTSFLFILALLFPLSDAGAVLIEIKDQAVVASESVRLHEVAAIRETASQKELDALRQTIICAAPPPAESQIIHAADIVSAVRHSQIPAAETKFAGSNTIVVKRDFDVVDKEEFIDAFAAYVTEKTGWPVGSFSIQPPKNLAPLPAPVGGRTLQVEVSPNERLCGSVMAEFTILVGRKQYRKIPHRFVVEPYVQTLVAVSTIKRGKAAEEGQFEISSVERSRIHGTPVTDEKQLHGKKAIRTIFPGAPLTTESFKSPPVAKRGAIAPVVLSGNGFNVTTSGKLLDDAYTSEIVRVRLPSKKIIEAFVTDTGAFQLTD